MRSLFCFGLGYSAKRIAGLLADQGWTIVATARTPAAADAIRQQGYEACRLDANATEHVRDAMESATHVLISAAPDAAGDPLLHLIGTDFTSHKLRWIGYLSTIGVYGDSGGAWIDETAPLQATSGRGQRRIAAEESWQSLATRLGAQAQIFRLAGIYGPGRSAIDRLREGTAHRIIKPGQVFNRIHVDDIAQAVIAGITGRGSEHVYNVTDDEPAPPQDIVTYAAALLHMPPPPEIPFEAAKLPPMAASFYADNKRVKNERLRQDLGVTLKFPTYREGLRDVLAASTAAQR